MRQCHSTGLTLLANPSHPSPYVRDPSIQIVDDTWLFIHPRAYVKAGHWIRERGFLIGKR